MALTTAPRADEGAAAAAEGAPGLLVVTIRRHGLALAGYLGLTLLFFWPILSDFSTRVLSNGEDGAAYLWNLWSIPRSILDGNWPFVTNDVFFPVGARTAFNTNMPLWGIVSWPLQAAFGLGVAANIVQLAAVVLSAMGAYLLTLHVCGDRRAAFVAGAAYAFIPFRFAHLTGHLSLNHLEFFPFGLLALLRLYEAPTRRRAVIFGVVAGLTFLTDLSYTVFLLIAAAVVAVCQWRRTATREMLGRLAQSGLVAGLVGLPLLGSMVHELVVHDYLDPIPGWGSAQNYSSDLLSWVTPSALQRVWGDTFLARDVHITGGERLAFPGFAVLGLAVVGAVVAFRQRRALWCALVGVFAILSFGPILHVNGATGSLFQYHQTHFTLPLPYIFLHFVPVLNGVRAPGRFSVVAILALDVLAALALARLARRNRRLGWAAAGIALVVTMVEFYPGPMVTQAVAAPRPYAAIAADPDPGAVLEVPLQWRTGFGTWGDTNGDHALWMYYATEHHKPLAGGMLARYPQRDIDRLLRIPVYRQLVGLQREPPDGEATFTASDLRRLGIGFIVYHRDRPRPFAAQYLASLGLPVLADDGTVIAWKVSPAGG